jgi:hypothetical protein
MHLLLLSLAIFVAQMNTLQEMPVVHLGPHNDVVQIGFGGKLLELINTPAIIGLPKTPPKLDNEGKPWVVRIKNLGPNGVTVADTGHFRAQINVGQTVQIDSNGAEYFQRR